MCQCICFATYVSSFQGVHSNCEIKSEMQLLPGTSILNSLCLSDVIWQSGSTLFLVMACCVAAPSHYLKQCWSVINRILWHLHESSFMGCTENGYQSAKSIWKLYFWSTATFARGHWVNAMLLHICIIVQFHNYNSNDFFHKYMLTIDISQLTSEGEVWDIYCEFKVWIMLYLCPCNAVYNIKIYSTVL